MDMHNVSPKAPLELFGYWEVSSLSDVACSLDQGEVTCLYDLIIDGAIGGKKNISNLRLLVVRTLGLSLLGVTLVG